MTTLPSPEAARHAVASGAALFLGALRAAVAAGVPQAEMTAAVIELAIKAAVTLDRPE